MHARTILREAVVAKLRDATGAGPRVFDSREYPPQPEECPMIIVRTPRDDVSIEFQAPRKYGVECTVQIEIYAMPIKSGTPAVTLSAARVLDDLIEQVEALLDSDRYLRAPNGDLAAAEGKETQVETDFTAESRSTLAGARVTWVYHYARREASQPLGGVVDLLITEVAYNVAGGNNTTPEAVDEIPSNS